MPVFIAWIRISFNAKSVDHFLILRRRPKLTLKDCSFQEYLGLSKLQSLAVTAFPSFMCSPESAGWKQWFDVLLGSGLLCSDVVAFESATRWVLPVWSLGVYNKGWAAGWSRRSDRRPTKLLELFDLLSSKYTYITVYMCIYTYKYMLPPPKMYLFYVFWLFVLLQTALEDGPCWKDLKMVEHLQQLHMARQKKYSKGEGVWLAWLTTWTCTDILFSCDREDSTEVSLLVLNKIL